MSIACLLGSSLDINFIIPVVLLLDSLVLNSTCPVMYPIQEDSNPLLYICSRAVLTVICRITWIQINVHMYILSYNYVIVRQIYKPLLVIPYIHILYCCTYCMVTLHKFTACLIPIQVLHSIGTFCH